MSSVLLATPQVTGNTAKLQVLQELAVELEQAQSGVLRVLDVGCAGAKGQFNLWTPLSTNQRLWSRLRLWGVDVQGIERARCYVQRQGWSNVELKTGSAYELASIFPPASFDIVVSTQVMEHLKHRKRFLENAHAVLVDGGTACFTMDSAHFPRRGPRGMAGLRSLATNAWAHLRGAAEQYFDHAVFDGEIEALYAQTGFTVEDKRFYCLHPLKELHNQKLGRDGQEQFLQHWKALEDLLNTQADFIASNKHYFMALYYKLRRRPEARP